MEEAHGSGQGVFDEHASGVAGDDLARGGASIVGEQDGGLVVSEVSDEELAEDALARTSLLLVDARRAVFAVGRVEGDGAPGRRRQVLDLGEQFWRAAA